MMIDDDDFCRNSYSSVALETEYTQVPFTHH